MKGIAGFARAEGVDIEAELWDLAVRDASRALERGGPPTALVRAAVAYVRARIERGAAGTLQARREASESARLMLRRSGPEILTLATVAGDARLQELARAAIEGESAAHARAIAGAGE